MTKKKARTGPNTKLKTLSTSFDRELVSDPVRARTGRNDEPMMRSLKLSLTVTCMRSGLP